MYPTGVVVLDRSGKVPDGFVVVGAPTVRRYADEGIVLLPYDADRVGERLGGYYRAGWGIGHVVESSRGARICPMLLRIIPDRPFVYWVAVCRADRPGASASFRLLSDPGASDSSVNLAATDGVGEARAENQHGTFVIGGKRHVSASDPGYLAVDLFGVASGVSVLVTAVSQSRIDAHYP